jgi:UDP-N-acetylglucosamine--dolichyl-phosphate N-acetylglucosaminephosphotransferase
MEPSVATFTEEKPLRKPVEWVMKLMAGLGLLWIKTDEEGKVIESSNFTLINLWLVWFGPMREDRLCNSLCAMQFVVGLIGLLARHKLALLIFTEDNWSV